jgi:transcriptional antiterminator NusG
VGSGNIPLGYPPASIPNRIGQNQESKAGAAKSPVQQGDQVRIISGPFYDSRGIVIEVDELRSKIRVMIDFFQRPTPVEVDFEQVKKV